MTASSVVAAGLKCETVRVYDPTGLFSGHFVINAVTNSRWHAVASHKRRQ